MKANCARGGESQRTRASDELAQRACEGENRNSRGSCASSCAMARVGSGEEPPAGSECGAIRLAVGAVAQGKHEAMRARVECQRRGRENGPQRRRGGDRTRDALHHKGAARRRARGLCSSFEPPPRANALPPPPTPRKHHATLGEPGAAAEGPAELIQTRSSVATTAATVTIITVR